MGLVLCKQSHFFFRTGIKEHGDGGGREREREREREIERGGGGGSKVDN